MTRKFQQYSPWTMAILAAVFVVTLPAAAGGSKLKASDVIARHLASIGTPEARAAAKSVVAEGKGEVQLLQGGSGSGAGPAMLIAEGPKLHFTIRIGQTEYPGEEFVFDGEHTDIGVIKGGLRSRLERYLYYYPSLISEGLIAGSLAPAWPLLDLESHKAKVDFDGLKKVKGKELYKLNYRPKKGSSQMQISLYFDPDTFRHVLTICDVVPVVGVDLTPAQTATDALSQYHQTLEEEFSDFRTVDGLTVPTHLTMRLTQQSGAGTSIMVFDSVYTTIKHNQPLGAKAFTLE